MVYAENYQAESEIIFLLDAADIKDELFIKPFISAMVTGYHINQHKTRVSIVIATEQPSVPIEFETFNSVTEFRTGVKNINILQAGKPDLVNGLKKVKEMITNKGREDIPKLVVLLTSSFMEDTGEQIQLTREIQEQGKVFLVIILFSKNWLKYKQE